MPASVLAVRATRAADLRRVVRRDAAERTLAHRRLVAGDDRLPDVVHGVVEERAGGAQLASAARSRPAPTGFSASGVMLIDGVFVCASSVTSSSAARRDAERDGRDRGRDRA